MTPTSLRLKALVDSWIQKSNEAIEKGQELTSQMKTASLVQSVTLHQDAAEQLAIARTFAKCIDALNRELKK